MPGLFLGRASRSAFSVVFYENRVNMGLDPLERPPTDGIPPIVPGATSGELYSNRQPNNLPVRCVYKSRITSVSSHVFKFVLIFFYNYCVHSFETNYDKNEKIA